MDTKQKDMLDALIMLHCAQHAQCHLQVAHNERLAMTADLIKEIMSNHSCRIIKDLDRHGLLEQVERDKYGEVNVQKYIDNMVNILLDTDMSYKTLMVTIKDFIENTVTTKSSDISSKNSVDLFDQATSTQLDAQFDYQCCGMNISVAMQAVVKLNSIKRVNQVKALKPKTPPKNRNLYDFSADIMVIQTYHNGSKLLTGFEALLAA